jgi:hypothetical protein
MRWFLALMLLPMAAGAQTVIVEEGRCRFVEVHRPAPDVAYRPGVDVNGNAVAPADLGGGNAVALPGQVPVRLQIPITRFLPVTPPFLDEAEIDVGEVLVDVETGALFYRGQRLDAPYAVLCDDDALLGAGRDIPPPPPARP